MSTVGKLVGKDASPMPWSPKELLPTLSSNEIRFSRGFLRSDVSVWLTDFVKSWQLLLHSLGLEVELSSVNNQFNFPESLSRVIPIELDDETAVIGMDDESQEIVSSVVAKGSESTAVDVIVEYFERRMLSCVSQHWSGPMPLKARYLADSESTAVDVVGTICFVFTTGGKDLKLWLGLGPRAVERIDGLWRKQLFEEKSNLPGPKLPQLSTVDIDLVELLVPPALLIDYMRSGTVVELDLPTSNKVRVNLNGNFWAYGELGQFEGNFAVMLEDFEVKEKSEEDSSSTTKVSVQLAVEEIDREAVLEFGQEKSILSTQVAVNDRASLIISGERVASAIIGELDGKFALTVLPK